MMGRSLRIHLIRPLGLLLAATLIALLGSSTAEARAVPAGEARGAVVATRLKAPPPQGTIPPRRADLQIRKSATRDGETIIFTIEVRNAGPAAAQDVIVVDRLPRQLVFGSAESDRGRCAAVPFNRLVICALGNLPSGASATITVETRLAPDVRAVRLRNIAVTLSRTADPNFNNNIARLIMRLRNQGEQENADESPPSGYAVPQRDDLAGRVWRHE